MLSVANQLHVLSEELSWTRNYVLERLGETRRLLEDTTEENFEKNKRELLKLIDLIRKTLEDTTLEEE